EVEQACARAIIVSKGKIVADGGLEDIRAKSGGVRYVVTVDEQGAESGKSAPSVSELKQAFEKLAGVKAVRELRADEKAHKVEVSGPPDSDLRAEIFRLMVQQGWTLLELRRDAQSLDAVFRELTKADEALDRGRAWDEATAEDDDYDDEDDSGDDEDEAEDEAAAGAEEPVAEAAEKR